ncbi:unnamed protein product [Darwinula stevensoni]|uniref:PAN-3 domain-containing protein n=1 Tax=Darwinula stevensoni TaxID=69355 RepID=A0A7R8XKL8_9CRUS|nr:unnamed protein product [Darwinula stevensoni]CAG0895888.1 unnamed protein product [Darwinula stevensoni]
MMKLLFCISISFFLTAMAAINSGNFYAPTVAKMKILSPIREFPVLSGLQCTMACLSETTCYSYSITKSAGLATCRLGGAYDPTRIADPDSEFFFTDVPPGYNLVPGTKSYVKIVLDTTKTSAQAKTECEKDGAGLAIPNQEPVHNYLNKTMMENAAKLTTTYYNFWVDGKAFPPNHFVWFFRDGTNVTITAKGQGHFHPNEPDYGEGCLVVTYKFIWVAPYTYGNWVEPPTCTDLRSGYFCEIRVPDVIPRPSHQ